MMHVLNAGGNGRNLHRSSPHLAPLGAKRVGSADEPSVLAPSAGRPRKAMSTPLVAKKWRAKITLRHRPETNPLDICLYSSDRPASDRRHRLCGPTRRQSYAAAQEQ